jgi:hypothetical protein
MKLLHLDSPTSEQKHAAWKNRCSNVHFPGSNVAGEGLSLEIKHGVNQIGRNRRGIVESQFGMKLSSYGWEIIRYRGILYPVNIQTREELLQNSKLGRLPAR